MVEPVPKENQNLSTKKSKIHYFLVDAILQTGQSHLKTQVLAISI